MATIIIKALKESVDLDREAMAAITGGFKGGAAKAGAKPSK